MHPYALGLDSSSDETWAYVPDDRDTAPVRSFGPCTPDLDALVDGRATCRMETVTIALTSVTRIPVSEILETRSFRVSLVHARHHTYVPGRKSAMQDGQWIPSLPTCSRLRGAFRPQAEMGALRASVAMVATPAQWHALWYHVLPYRTPFRDLSPKA